MKSALSEARVGLRVRRRRAVLTGIGIALAAAMLSAAVVVSDSLGRGFGRAASKAHLADIIVRFDPLRASKVEQRVGALPDLKAFSLRREVTGVDISAGAHDADNAAAEVLDAGHPGPRGYAIVAGRDVFTYTRPIVGIPQGTAPSILNRSFTITADIEVPADGGEGMLVTEGGRFGGWAFYLLKGKPVFVYNLLDLARARVESAGALSPGKHTVKFDFTYEGAGFGKGGTAVIKVDGTEVANQKLPYTIPFALEASETFDVGSDTGTGVDDADYQPPFAFTGKLNKLTLSLGQPQLMSEDEKRLREFQLNYSMSQ